MGGQAFASGPNALYTPRMPPGVYHHMKNELRDALAAFFSFVAVPVEAPEKEDYGDIDFVIVEAGEHHDGYSHEEARKKFDIRAKDRPDQILRKILKPERVISGGTANYAVPWPSGFDVPAPPSTDNTNNTTTTPATPAFIQVDVALYSSRSAAEWKLFKHAHGDLWNMLGAVIRPAGLTVNEQALYVCVPEIEDVDKKRARVFLSSTPKDVLRFLGLGGMEEEETEEKEEKEGGGADGRRRIRWDQPFPTVDALFAYVASCPLFEEYAARAARREERDAAAAAADAATAGDDGGGDADASNKAVNVDNAAVSTAVAASRKRALKSNDRKRLKQRGVFRRFVDEFVPAYVAARRKAREEVDRGDESKGDDGGKEGGESPNLITRRSVRLRVFDFFPGAEQRYAAALHDWRGEKTRLEVARFVKEYRPPGYYSLVEEQQQQQQQQEAGTSIGGGGPSSVGAGDDAGKQTTTDAEVEKRVDIQRQQHRRGLTAAAFRKILQATESRTQSEALDILREAGLLPSPPLQSSATSLAVEQAEGGGMTEPEAATAAGAGGGWGAGVVWGVGAPWSALKDPQTNVWNVETTKAWVVENWERVGNVAMRRANASYVALKEKAREHQESRETEPVPGSIGLGGADTQDKEMAGTTEGTK